MCLVPESGGARGAESFLWRPSLACRARLLQVFRLLQVPGRAALHGGEELPVLLRGVQEESLGVEMHPPPPPKSSENNNGQ